jgi:hypothetical protein
MDSFHFEEKFMNRIRWTRILGGGFLSELCVFIVFIPSTVLLGQTPGVYAAVLGSFVMPFLFGIWTARKAEGYFVFHGFMVGAVGVLIYLGLTRLGPEPLLYIFAHFLKLLGGAAGGYFASNSAIARKPPVSTVVGG